MAASYNLAVYTALINLEHIKSYLPDSTFNRYGKVQRRCLLKKSRKVRWQARWRCMPMLSQQSPQVELVKKARNYSPLWKSARSSLIRAKPTLVGSAATDDPASLGTEMLTFSASAAHNPLANRNAESCKLFTAAERKVIELEEIRG